MTGSKYHFESLTPTDNVDLNVYEEAINYIFENPDIKNVAISGAYSAGKSSVLASYKKAHSEVRFLHISLAHFQSQNDKNEIEVKESILEGKILNQLLHQIPSEKIPQTNFRVKKRINLKSLVVETLEIIVFLVAVIYFACFDSLKSYISTLPVKEWNSALILLIHPYALIIDGIVIIGLLGALIYRLIKTQKNKNIFRKLNFQGNEIEIFQESEDSYFDKYLNEVLYLFENADVDVIVFEDMDRFNENRIFERLREVNTLANIQLQKENKKVLRFFYLLRDDLFVSKDRTKFFDYIVPIVPVLDSSNSYDQFVFILKKNGIFDKFSEEFLQGLSLYVDDMRILKNIYNEFIVYYNKLNITELDCNKMLAIIAYKNLFPRDFADLQLNRGFVYTLFEKRDRFVNSKIVEIKKAIEEKENVAAAAKREHLESVYELNVVFAERYLRNHNWQFYDNNKLDDYVSQHLSGDPLERYSTRKKKLKDLLNLDNKKNEYEILQLKQKLLELRSKQLKYIIDRDNIDTVFSITNENEIGEVVDFNEVKSNDYFDLLKYLIRNGYIDETYADYMTYFYENSISRVDKIFLRSITDEKAKGYDYQLENPQKVMSFLRPQDFNKEEILNYSLLTYLLQTECHEELLEKLIVQLSKSNKFEFIRGFFEITSEMPTCVKYLNMWWPDFFSNALIEEELDEEQIRDYSIFTLYFSDEDTLTLINKDDALSVYISCALDYLEIEDPIIQKLIDGFKLLKVRFKTLSYENSDKDLFSKVYQESLYEINEGNLWLIMHKILNISSDEDFEHKNYSLLCSYPDSAITQYINRNINKYFEVVLKMSGGTIFDDEKVAALVLNNTELTIEHKKSYIFALKTPIALINAVTDHTLWPLLLDKGIVLYSAQNIVDSYKELKLNKCVTAYINRCDINLDFSKIEIEEGIKKNLFNDIVESSAIENSKYESMLVSLGYSFENFETADISADKLAILIEKEIIRMTAENLNYLRENYEKRQRLYFIYRNIEKYLDIMTVDLFLQEELLEILTWKIEDEQKIRLLKFSGEEISIVEQNYSTPVCLYILDNNFKESDLIPLFASFEEWDDRVQKKIFEYALRNIPIIIDAPNSISKKLYDDLLKSSRIDQSIKISLFIAIIPDLNLERIIELLQMLELTEYLKLFDASTRLNFKVDDENEKLLTALKERGIIYDFFENPKREGYYRIRKHKTK